MLRISRLESEDAVIFILEGKLLVAWLTELMAAIEGASKSKPVILDLAALSFADAAGARLLARLERDGVSLRSASALLTALIGAAAP